MSVLFGHPSGSINSFHAALSHYEHKRLAAFCVPWMPRRATLRLLETLPRAGELTRRLSRRRFEPLADVPMIQGRAGEIRRLVMRALGLRADALAVQANEWLMNAMGRECGRPDVTAVHAYEDCALHQFEEARRQGKACIYDMPIGYFRAWQKVLSDLGGRYGDWMPSGTTSYVSHTPVEQKQKELALADLVIVPSAFVESTIREYVSNKTIAGAPYGVDLDFWKSDGSRSPREFMRFLYVGHASVRKGTPLLLEAWKKAALKNAELLLVGPWRLAENKRLEIQSNVRHIPSCSSIALRERYAESDVFVFPSFFEGFGLVVLEAMSCGLPTIASQSTCGRDVLTPESSRVLPTGDVDALVDSLRWFSSHREALPAMSLAARRTAERYTWANYRDTLSKTVDPFV